MNLINSNNRCSEGKFQIIEWTPLHTRVIAHRIGDGTLNYYKKIVWDNKHIEGMLGLLNKLNIKYWKPIKGDKYGTYKMVLPKFLFEEFSNKFDRDYNQNIEDPCYLLDSIQLLDKEHKLQALCALITDDGSFVNWVPVIFEDQNEKTVMKVKRLWDSLFPGNSRVSYILTKKGTKVYHLYSNRDGVIKLFKEIKNAKNKFGDFADLWHKQKDLETRFKKATNKRADVLYETKVNKERWKNVVLDGFKSKRILRFSEIKKILNLDKYRTWRITNKLVKERKIFLIDAGNKSRYSLEDIDISQDHRERVILDFVKNNKIIKTRDVCKLLDLKMGQSYKILKRMVNKKIIKQSRDYYSL